MSPELQEELYRRYPAIFAERDLSPDVSPMGFGVTAEDGWFALIDALCASLQYDADNNGEPQPVASQVKQKVGELRFNLRDTGTPRQKAMIEVIRVLSSRICEICGKPEGELDRRSTRCPEHRRPPIVRNGPPPHRRNLSENP
jgi:hypothetical protein